MATAAPQPARSSVRFFGLLDQAAASHRAAVLLLIVVTLLAVLPGFFGIPPIDRDEALFAQISKQMIETGDYVDIRFQDQDFYKKPAGINWLQAAAVKASVALGMPSSMNSIWVYRIPSLLGALAAVLLTYWAALGFVARRPALLAALMLAVSLMLGIQARLARTDEVLLAVFVAALGAMGRIYLAERQAERQPLRSAKGWGLPAIFWTAMAAGVLLKGPFILLFMGLVAATLVVAGRSLRWIWAFRPLLGLLWLGLLLLPWLAAIVSRTGFSFFADSIGHDMLGKVAEGQESHGAPPGYYLVLFIATFFPASVLAAPAVPRAYALRRQAWVRFLLAWILPAWIIFELVPTKLPHYVLPLYPAIAILIAEAMEAGKLSRNRWLLLGTIAWFLIPLLLSAAAIGGVIYLTGDPVLLAWPFALGAAALGFLAWWRYRAEGAEAALLRAAGAAILMAIAVFGVALPAMTPVFPSLLIARAVREAGCPDPLVASVGYDEPSLVFLLGTKTQLTDPYHLLDFLRPGGCRIAFVEAAMEPLLAKQAGKLGIRYERGPLIEGINYSKGRRISMVMLRAEGAP
jgi:4-amino-4-deoxy-L-arabinose transferase-like glycosyltransferase